ncbi:MAG: LolA family protein [Vulcanimicrobiaceae bacterium]
MTSRVAALFFACAFCALGLAASAHRVAQQPITVDDVIANMVARNAELTTFEARISIRLHSGIPFLNPALEGNTYYKRPDRYEVVFTKYPSWAKSFEALYSDIGDPAVWYKRFSCSLHGTRTYKDHTDLVLRLIQRVRGEIDHEDVLVDPRRWVIDEMEYVYYRGGHITVDQTYRQESGFYVLNTQHAMIAMPPFPRARADAQYSEYRLNVAIDDSVFTKEQTQRIGVGAK